jgi:hypothetical protein
MFDKKFLQASAERAIKTFAQALLALFGANAANVLTSDLGVNLKIALGASVLSVLTSVVSANIGNQGPSLAGETTAEPRIITIEVPVPAPAATTAKKRATAAAAKPTPKPKA